MQGLLVIALLNGLTPNCGTSNLSSFANKQVTFSKSKTPEIGRGEFNDANVS
jgi:hypothetical protein